MSPSEPSPGQHSATGPRRGFTLTSRISLLVAILLLASALITTLFSLRSIQNTMFTQSQESVHNVHTSITAMLRLEYQNNLAYREQTLETRKAQLKDLLGNLTDSLDAIEQQVKEGNVSLAHGQSIAKDLIVAMRFGPQDTDYFFAYNRQMDAIAHPDPQFQGRNLLNLQDASGRYFVKEIRDTALNVGDGFVTYDWQRLGDSVPRNKISYVTHYEPWDWILGVGLYTDDVDADVSKHLKQTTQSMSATFDQLSFGTEGFPFILDESGAPVVAPPNVNLTWLTDSPSGISLARELQSTAAASSPTMVSVNEPADLDGEGLQDWVMTASTFPELSWTVVTAMPYSELAAPGRRLAWELGLLSLAVLAIGLACGLLMSRRIVRPVADITGAAEDLVNDSFDPSRLDKAAHRSDEVGQLARVFQRMGVELAERERKLREKVARLEVQIDQTKVAAAVSEITDSDYFTRLREQSQELRRRMKDEAEE